MSLLATFDRSTIALQRRLLRPLTPTPEQKGFPSFEARIKARHRRWHDDPAHAPFAATLGEKIRGQDYVRSLGYPVPEVYGVYPSIHDLPELSALPPRVVIKPVDYHSSRGVYLVRDGINLFDNQPVSRASILSRATTPELAGPTMAEELLQDFDGRPGVPRDFKFWCFGPKIVAVHVYARNSLTQPWLNQHWFRTLDWKPLPVRLKWEFYPERSQIDKPPFWAEMVAMVTDMATRLGVFMRIDMYATTRGPVYGEFTAFPCMGQNYTYAANLWLGELWRGPEGTGGP